jgi:hypothetical protein
LLGKLRSGREIVNGKAGDTKRLVERFPKWFDVKGDVRHTLMSSGFLHGDGWFDIVWRLFEELEPSVVEFDPRVRVPI